MEIYKRLLYAKILAIHDEFAYDMSYDMALGNVSHGNDDCEANKYLEQHGLKNY